MQSPDLDWLPLPSASWGEALAAAATTDTTGWDSLVALAQSQLDGLQTLRLDRRLLRLFGDAPPPGLTTAPVRLAVLGSSTLDHLLPGIRVGALRRGLWLTVYTGDYGQHAAELANPGSAVYEFRPDAVLFAFDASYLLRAFAAGADAAAASRLLADVCMELQSYWNQAQASGWSVVQQTCLPTFPALLGSNEHRAPSSPAEACRLLNGRLRELADAGNVDLLAVDARAAQDGIRAWYDPMLWHRAKQEVHPGAAPLYGDLLGRLLAARQGRSSKALVLDLDNTLWSGVIGDDGMDGIVLGQGSTLGEAHTAFQHYAKALSRRGVILAVCSKNDEVTALEPFERHPEMVLRRSDIACFVANWTDKATNLRTIAQQLNIGLDSLVFVDDNPAERAIIRRELPMVAVPEMPDDPAGYAQCVADAGYFEATRLTSEDLERGNQYQANLQREVIRASATDMDGYLRSLEMEMRWSRFDTVSAGRIVQLVNKTNQLNLTTCRTTPEAVASIIADPAALSLQLRLLDQFGDNGIIAIVHGHKAGQDMVLDTWLMSCRVLGRGVESATLNLIALEAQRLGAARLAGTYSPTAKNGMVRDHYARLSFAATGTDDDGTTHWVLSLDGFQPLPAHIRITEVK